MLLWLFTNVGKNSAIDIYNMTIHKIRCVRSQENCRSLQILCLSPSRCRSLCNNKLVKRMSASIRLDLTQWSRLRCCNVTRSDTVTLDVVFAILRCNIFCKHFQSALCSCVCRYCLTAKF